MLQGGSAQTLYKSVWSRILSLPENFCLYPAHDYKVLYCTVLYCTVMYCTHDYKGMMFTTVGEEKLHNPRLTKSLEDYVKIMEGLGLAYPKKIDESMPANMECGLFQLPERMKDWV